LRPELYFVPDCDAPMRDEDALRNVGSGVRAYVGRCGGPGTVRRFSKRSRRAAVAVGTVALVPAGARAGGEAVRAGVDSGSPSVFDAAARGEGG